MHTRKFIEYVRQPEYTGENRCTPCTALNLLIASGITGALALVSLPVAALFFVFAATAIWVRGYLVPGTPTLTKRYLPAYVLRLFGKNPTVDPEPILRNIDAIESCERDSDLCLTDEFRRVWRDEIEIVRETEAETARLAELFDVDPEQVSIEETTHVCLILVNGEESMTYESRAALQADLAAMPEIRDRYANWNDLDLATKASLFSGLRLFLEMCPECGNDLTLSQETVESCCRSADVITVSCNTCDTRMREFESV